MPPNGIPQSPQSPPGSLESTRPDSPRSETSTPQGSPESTPKTSPPSPLPSMSLSPDPPHTQPFPPFCTTIYPNTPPKNGEKKECVEVPQATQFYMQNLVQFYNIPLMYKKLGGIHKSRDIDEYAEYFQDVIMKPKSDDNDKNRQFNPDKMESITDALFKLFNKDQYSLNMDKFMELSEYLINSANNL